MIQRFLAPLALAMNILLTPVLAPAAALAQPVPYQIETIAEGLNHPWSIAFLPDGDMLVTERSGQLRRISAGQLVDEPITGVPEVFEQSQGGLFDIVLDPAFEANGVVFLTYAWGASDANGTRLVRARLDGDTLVDPEILFTPNRLKNTMVHYGGRLTLLPDGTLLLAVGDGFDFREQAQVTTNHLGSFIRLNEDGSVPEDNPFYGRDGVLQEIFSIGHRNPQGLVVDPVTGRIFSHEHGPAGGDELNLIEPGANYGWPIATFGMDYDGALVTPYTEYPGMRQPLVVWVPSIAPSGLAIYRGDMFPEWVGDIFVGALIAGDAPDGIGGHVRRVDMDETVVLDQEILFAEIGARIRDIRVAPDGSLFILTDEDHGRVLRIHRVE